MQSLPRSYQVNHTHATPACRGRSDSTSISQFTAGEVPYKSQVRLSVNLNKASHSTQGMVGGCSQP